MTRRGSPEPEEQVVDEGEAEEAEEDEEIVDETLPEVSNLGFAIDILNVFIEECGGRDVIKERSVSYMLQHYVKRFTNSKKVTYCEEMATESKWRPFIGPATVWVSYSSADNFLAISDLLNSSFADSKAFLWWDLFSSNHHISDSPCTAEWYGIVQTS